MQEGLIKAGMGQESCCLISREEQQTGQVMRLLNVHRDLASGCEKNNMQTMSPVSNTEYFRLSLLCVYYVDAGN